MGKTLIRGNLVIDGAGGPPIDRGSILIEGQRIIEVGKEENLREKADAHVLDCSDQTLLPGLIDCHNHLSLDPRVKPMEEEEIKPRGGARYENCHRK